MKIVSPSIGCVLHCLLAKLEAPLHAMLEGRLQGIERSRRAADSRRMTAGEGAEERERAWKRVRDRGTDGLCRAACANCQVLSIDMDGRSGGLMSRPLADTV